VRDVFAPNRQVSERVAMTVVLVQVTVLLGVWLIYPAGLLPTPGQVVAAFGTLWQQGIAVELGRSFSVNVRALLYASVISLGLSYLTVVPFFRPPAGAASTLRFLGLTGLTLPFTLMTGGGEALKVAMLTFGMTVFMVTGMAAEVAKIPREAFDHARTLRMGEWRTVWDVVILGKMDAAFEIVRQNAAIGWMMVTMVEGIVRSSGGIGTVLIARNKQLDKLSEVVAILILVLLTGIFQDQVLRYLSRLVCPWAYLTLERS
jgi:NitT/TauT family transport system permease protein